jgi:hypothetical protein
MIAVVGKCRDKNKNFQKKNKGSAFIMLSP